MGARFLHLGLCQSRLGLQQRVLGRLQVEGGHHLIVEERLLAVGGHAATLLSKSVCLLSAVMRAVATAVSSAAW